MKTRFGILGRAALLAGALAAPTALMTTADAQQPVMSAGNGAVQTVRWEPGPPGGVPYYGDMSNCPCPTGGGNPYSWHGSRSANRFGWHVVYFDARLKTNFLNLLGYNRPPCTWKWSSVYQADPNYCDPRDGRVYSAQGYGTPMSVPLAPNVKHSYNYGWGVPSSRLTPVAATYQRYNGGSYGAQTAGIPAPAGQQVAYPQMVYAPTDTTQYGFYYSHVPTWQPVQRSRWSEMQATPVSGQVIMAPVVAPATQAPATPVPTAPAPIAPGGTAVPAPIPPQPQIPAAPASVSAPVANPGISVPENVSSEG